MKPLDATEAVRQARASVEGLEEPYKMEAFKLVLERLMAQSSHGTPAGPAENRKQARPNKARTKSKASPAAPRAEKVKSSLSLSVDQLKKLQTYFIRFAIKGG